MYRIRIGSEEAIKKTPVAIVGSGPGGTSMSMFLSQMGIANTIIGRSRRVGAVIRTRREDAS
ncbi:MAG: FAD-dependent monooxygenase [Chloroflexi bacterium]|nr:FAD-dependent monooxygenase [Chloroflexota bacterium]